MTAHPLAALPPNYFRYNRPMSRKTNPTPSELAQRNRELAILKTIADALNREVDLQRALDAALEQIGLLFNVSTSWVWLQREDTGGTYLAAVRNLPPGLSDDPARMDGSVYCYCLDTYRLGELDDARNISAITCTRLKELEAGAAGLRYHASVPLYHHQRRVGLLNVVSADRPQLSPDELRLLNTVGDMLSIAIERAQLFETSIALGALQERNRLAREIHDTLAQGLSAIALHLETADLLLEQDVVRARAAVNKALDLARSNLEEARRSVMDLRAAPLELHRFGDALEELVKRIGDDTHLAMQVEVIGRDRPLAPRLETGLYRIAQEALHNVVRHANARSISVRFVALPEVVELTIEDDGDGFNPNDVDAGHFGLIGLNERARLLGGTLEICTAPGDGTSIHVRVPLSQEGR
ncbi:MAG: GAF domain-containing sensor histidine kinase [Chloroflexi bacterium]|nr:GAF domain-containing sensor histidine kinase [Chloroflexota bacterium]